jgi:NAD(P)-dependent dehydrogenase (short-subunit alcohol dehydrogenase family)
MSAADAVPRTVVITGASTGIGEACALELDRLGFRVFAGVRSEEAGRNLRVQASSRLAPLRIDVTDMATIAAAARTIGEAIGDVGIAGLVNNAGVAVAGPIEFVPIDDLRQQLEVNVIGQVAVTQAMMPLLRIGRGRIVNIGSISGLLTAPYAGPYSASKFALEAVTNALRLELRNSGIKVSILEPGNVKTPIWDKSIARAQEKAERASPEADRLYRSDMEQMQRWSLEMRDTAMPVGCVVRAVVHALTARRPKRRYPVGTQARLASFFFRFFPDSLRDTLILRSLGLR